MFSQDQENKQVDVIVRVADGTELQGKLVCGLSGSINSALNKEGAFIELHDKDNKVVFIAKLQIATVEPAKNAEQVLPKLKAAHLKSGNWTQILGVGHNATAEEAKDAYHKLAKQYHPDKFALDTPLEIKQYASEMLSRINVAYDQFICLKQAA